MCSIPLPSVTARHELTIRAASACTTTVGRSPPGRLSRAFQQASQFSTVWVSSSLKRFTAMARCSREPITRFIHRGGKGVVKRTDRTGLRRPLMSALIKTHGTKPYLRHIEAEICPPDEAGALSANDQGILIVWTSPIRMAVIAVPDLLHRSRNDPEGAARRWRPGVRLNSGLLLTAGRSDADAPWSNFRAACALFRSG